MPKRKLPEEDPKEQFERFIKAATQHGLDDATKRIDEEFDRLSRKRRRPKKASSTTEAEDS